MWHEITKELYSEIYNKHEKDFTVFGSFTNMENNSRFDARILTEWGFKWAKNPCIKYVTEPKSQEFPGEIKDWPIKYYIFLDDDEEFT
jgi:hypothetical protein